MLQLDKCYTYPTMHVVAYIINWATVVINPIIYCVSQKKYQVKMLIYTFLGLTMTCSSFVFVSITIFSLFEFEFQIG